MAQAILVNILQQGELWKLPPVLALAPAGMAIITVMIVVLHFIVNAEDVCTKPCNLKKLKGSWQRLFKK